jgi:protein O-GlcNAc transferase
MTDATATLAAENRTEYGQWLARGREHQGAGRPIDALICYRRALTANPYAVQARYRLGQVLRMLRREEEARDVWRAALALQPGHILLQLSLAASARLAGAYAEAIERYQQVLAGRPQHRGARMGLGLSRLATGDENGYEDLNQVFADDGDSRWEDFTGLLESVAETLQALPSSPRRQAVLSRFAAKHGGDLPPKLVALIAEETVVAGDRRLALELLEREESIASSIREPETLRRLARASVDLGSGEAWSERYAAACAAEVRAAAPLLWPLRTPGEALRVAYLVSPNRKIDLGGVLIEPQDYLSAVVAAHPPETIEATVYVIAETDETLKAALPSGFRIVPLGAAPQPQLARTIAEIDADALIDLAGIHAPVGPILAQRPARSRWTYAGMRGANAAPLIHHLLPAPEAADRTTLDKHRSVLEDALWAASRAAPWFTARGTRTASELASLWTAAVAAHQAGEIERALAAYREVLAEQPGCAPAQFLLGILLREVGLREEARSVLTHATVAAPYYVDARVALANALRESGLLAEAVELCRTGLDAMPEEAGLWRALGEAQLEQRDGVSAHRSFARALELKGEDATTHYNDGVALQMMNRRGEALRAYQRALVLDPALHAADFNIGVIFREQGHAEAAIKAFREVLQHDPRHAPAHKALAETLLEVRKLDEWFAAFERFEEACPNALPMACLALEVCQYRADFPALDRYIDRLSRDDFKPSSETELVDCLEVLLFLLLYFDVDPDVHFGLYETYNKAAPNVYGRPLALPAERRPGRIRVGYLSGDLRNHVMGKMMWSAIEHHDRERFELFFYSLSEQSDEWTERFRGIASRFEAIANLTEGKAAERIAEDELDILVDLGTHTHGSKPGILALKPARVQITHVASAGVVGLSTIDFKLTDAFADLPEMQRFQLETFLPMDGCVYPYRTIAPAADHPFHRDRLGIASDAVVIGAFVNPLKLSRRCLTLWRQVLDAIPHAVLAISPISPERQAVYTRLFSAIGIDERRVCVLPQGRNEAQNQARYTLIDFALDPLPYGGANGTLEALSMGVPVVTLVGAKHGERCGYSMLANLGAMHTVAASGTQYVEIAVRLATDAAFMTEVRGAILAGLESSPLTDMVAHTRNLERAYERALELRYPDALADA